MNKNYQFYMKADVSCYTGEWVAVCGQRIVSHGKDFTKVLTDAKTQCPKEVPFIARVPEDDDMIL